MLRVSVVGNAGSGKSQLASRIAAAIDAVYIELDAIHHLPGWVPIAPERFLSDVDRITAAPRWVIDGNYRTVVLEGPVWQRADTVVWLRLPRQTVLRQVVGRTVVRAFKRTELWNGNREPWSNFYRWDPNKNIIRWAWTRHAVYEQRFQAARHDPRFRHLQFVVLNSHAQADKWLAGLKRVGG